MNDKCGEMYDSRVVANRLIELAHQHDNTLTPMQLIKLVYIAHGWMLGLYHRPLLRDEVQAWRYGPVIPHLYSAVRENRGRAVVGPLASDGGKLDARADDIVVQVYRRYGTIPGMHLSRLTHARGTPWAQMYSPGIFGVAIPDDLIEGHYARYMSSGNRNSGSDSSSSELAQAS